MIWKLAFAARYDREERDVNNQVPNVMLRLRMNAALPSINPALAAILMVFLIEVQPLASFQPKVTWSWNAAEDINLYASWGVGFRSGGFNSIGSEALMDSGTIPDQCASGTNPGVRLMRSCRER